MTITWDELRAVEGIRLGAAAYRYQTCPRCGLDVDTLEDEGMETHRDRCQPSFKTTTPYDKAVLQALAAAVKPCEPAGSGPDGLCTTCNGAGEIFPAENRPRGALTGARPTGYRMGPAGTQATKIKVKNR